MHVCMPLTLWTQSALGHALFPSSGWGSPATRILLGKTQRGRRIWMGYAEVKNWSYGSQDTDEHIDI